MYDWYDDYIIICTKLNEPPPHPKLNNIPLVSNEEQEWGSNMCDMILGP